MDLQLKDKVIIVTGGAKGIGEGIVRVLANEGAIPVIVGRNEEDNKKLQDEILAEGKQAFEVVAELTNPDECKKAVDAVIAKFNRIDAVVNNAGVNDGVVPKLPKQAREILRLTLQPMVGEVH
jgi:NAD(P)-dependent dehydrogenase (short-subunit alcohol dehydrogenase family)